MHLINFSKHTDVHAIVTVAVTLNYKQQFDSCHCYGSAYHQISRNAIKPKTDSLKFKLPFLTRIIIFDPGAGKLIEARD